MTANPVNGAQAPGRRVQGEPAGGLSAWKLGAASAHEALIASDGDGQVLRSRFEVGVSESGIAWRRVQRLLDSE